MSTTVFVALDVEDDIGPSPYTPNTLYIGDDVTIQGSPEALAKLRDAIIKVASAAAERANKPITAVGGD